VIQSQTTHRHSTKGIHNMGIRGSDLTPLTLVSFRIPQELLDDLELVADKRQEPKTALIRQALEEYLQVQKNRRKKAS